MVIIVVAVIVVGPDRLPGLMRTFGKLMREVRKVTGDLGNVRDELKSVVPTEDLRRQIKEEMQIERVRETRKDVENEIDALRARLKRVRPDGVVAEGSVTDDDSEESTDAQREQAAEAARLRAERSARAEAARRAHAQAHGVDLSKPGAAGEVPLDIAGSTAGYATGALDGTSLDAAAMSAPDAPAPVPMSAHRPPVVRRPPNAVRTSVATPRATHDSAAPSEAPDGDSATVAGMPIVRLDDEEGEA